MIVFIACILVFSSVSECLVKIDQTRYRRSPLESVDLDKLSDDDVFALLEKPEEDYVFPTEEDIDLFNFDKSDDDEFPERTTIHATIKPPLSTTVEATESALNSTSTPKETVPFYTDNSKGSSKISKFEIASTETNPIPTTTKPRGKSSSLSDLTTYRLNFAYDFSTRAYSQSPTTPRGRLSSSRVPFNTDAFPTFTPTTEAHTHLNELDLTASTTFHPYTSKLSTVTSSPFHKTTSVHSTETPMLESQTNSVVPELLEIATHQTSIKTTTPKSSLASKVSFETQHTTTEPPIHTKTTIIGTKKTTDVPKSTESTKVHTPTKSLEKNKPTTSKPTISTKTTIATEKTTIAVNLVGTTVVPQSAESTIKHTLKTSPENQPTTSKPTISTETTIATEKTTIAVNLVGTTVVPQSAESTIKHTLKTSPGNQPTTSKPTISTETTITTQKTTIPADFVSTSAAPKSTESPKKHSHESQPTTSKPTISTKTTIATDKTTVAPDFVVTTAVPEFNKSTTKYTLTTSFETKATTSKPTIRSKTTAGSKTATITTKSKTTPSPKSKLTTERAITKRITTKVTKVSSKVTTAKPVPSSTKRPATTAGSKQWNDDVKETTKNGRESKPIPSYSIPNSNSSDSGPICFKLMKPDNTLSDECFYPNGILPTQNPTSKKKTTLRPIFPTRMTTENITTKVTTAKPTVKPVLSSTKRSATTAGSKQWGDDAKETTKNGKESQPIPSYSIPNSNSSDSGPICFKLMKPDNTLSDECFYPNGILPTQNPTSKKKKTLRPIFPTRMTTENIRTKVTKMPTKVTTAKPTVKPVLPSTKRPATTAGSKQWSDDVKETTKNGKESQPIPSYSIPNSNSSNSGPICFKLMKPDNTLSDECFYPNGILPTQNPASKNKTTLRSIFTTTTEKITTKKPGGNQICFKLMNADKSSSECFYLNVNPSEAPIEETIATLAPHRMFEIIEEPPLLHESIPLVDIPPTVTQNVKPKSPEVATFAPNRMFDIPLGGGSPYGRKNKKDQRNNEEPRAPTTDVPKLSVTRKFLIPDNDPRTDRRNNFRSKQEPFVPHNIAIGTPAPRWFYPGSDQVATKGRNVVKFQPKIRIEFPPHRGDAPSGGRDRPKVDNPDNSHNIHYDKAPRVYFVDANRTVPNLPWDPMRPPRKPAHGSKEGYGASTFNSQHPVASIPIRFNTDGQQTEERNQLAHGNVFLIPANGQLPPNKIVYSEKRGSPQNGQHFIFVPGNRNTGSLNEHERRKGYEADHPPYLPNGSIPFRANFDNRQGGLQNPLAQRNVILIPAQGLRHKEGTTQDKRQFMLIPSNPSSHQDSLVSNVRLSGQSSHVGRYNPAPDNSRSRPILFRQTRPHPEQTISNIRIQVPQQGSFSQQAYVSNTDPQRAYFDHLYLDVTKHNSTNSDGDEKLYRQRSRRAAPGTPIDQAEAISLGFVVDTTASMRTELNEVKRYALIIMNEVLNNRGSHIENFIFVPIHDEIPVHELHFLVTRDRDTMSRTISKIDVKGGGTCPENSLIGLLKAIELAEKDSHIFLFTDAYAQDYQLVPEVIRMIQKKKPRIYFLLTGQCKKAENDKQRFAFDNIAAASTGIVAKLDKNKDHIRLVLGAVAREFEKNRRIVTEHEGEATGENPKDIKINVDPGLTNLSLTSTGQNTKIDVMGPSGRPRDIVQVVDMPNIQIISVPKPDPGEWTVSVSSPESPFKFVASGISTTDFLYGFSVSPTNETSRLSKHPKQGVKNHLLLVAKDPSVLWNISNVHLVVGSDIFETLPINLVNQDLGIYSGGPILFPDTSFKIRINAFTKEGYPLTRLTKATIIPQMPGPPEIDCKRKMVATAGLPFNMTCSVESLVPMDIQMYKVGSAYSHTLRYSQTSEVVLQFAHLDRSDGGDYVIYAKNSAGNTSQIVNLIVEELPPSVDLERNLVIAPGLRQIIKCAISSYTEYSIRWMKSEAPPDNFYRSGSYFLQTNNDNLIIEDNKVIIDPVRPEDEGWYICSAKNDGGEKTAHSFLRVQEPPAVSIDSFDGLFKKGDRLSITCRVQKGIPTPSLSWFDNFGQRITYELNKRVVQREIDSLQLIIHGAVRKDEGRYTCVGGNQAGNDSKQVTLQYVEVPRIEVEEDWVPVLTGERLRLQCNCSGIPVPKIAWSRITKDNPNPVPVESSRKKLPGQYLELEEVLPDDSGTYICTATNAGGSREKEIEVVVGFKPRIHHLAKKHIANINLPIELFCDAFGIPDPVISWTRADGTPIRGVSIDGLVKIENAILEDGGLYVCMAQNTFGRAESATLLVVEGAVKPHLERSTELEVVKTIASQTVTLLCPVVESVPPPTISWYLNGTPVHYYPGIFVSKEDDSLRIMNFNIKLAGNYSCEAVNPAGNDTKTFLLKLYEMPVIRPLPGMMPTAEGQRFSLMCTASGDPAPEITWLKQDGSIVSSTNELLIERVQLSDAGKYLCKASNLAGTEQIDFSLKVLIPPKIKEWEPRIVAKVGERIRLHCDASGDPKPTIRWFKDNRELMRIGIEYYSFEATPSVPGVYSCNATNGVGAAAMVNTSVIIFETPLIRDIAPVTQVIAGSSVSLKCSAMGNPYPTLSWIFKGVTLVKQDVGNDSAVLQIQRVSDLDAGIYYCLANSTIGNDQRKTELRVLQPPKVLCRTTTYYVVPGELAELHCDVSASPRARVTWYKDGDEFGFVSSEGILQFIARQEDAGALTVVATNKAGNSSQVVNVIVLKPPSFSPLLINTAEAVVGTNVSLPCEAQGDPKPEITWEQLNYPVLPNKLALDPATGELHIFDIDLKDEGTYTCKAKNRAGLSSHTISLNVSSRPHATVSSWDLNEGIIMERQEIMLICDTSGKPSPEITWTKDGFPLNPFNHTHNRNKLRFITTESSSGNYSCTAKNAVGQVTASLYVNVVAKPSIENSQNQYITKLLGQKAELECVAHGNPRPSVSWFRNGEELRAFPEFVVMEDQLIIPSLAADMEGSFICKATNYLGVAEKQFTVTINSVPVISDDVPSDLKVYELNDFAIPCKAIGKPIPTIHWRIGNEFLASGPFATDKYVILGDGTLVIRNITVHELQREFDCIAKNSEGNDSKTFKITILELPITGQALKKLIKDNVTVDVVEIPEAGSKRLVCAGGKGEWLKNGGPLKHWEVERGDDPHYSLKDGGRVLLISDATDTDIANYSCIYPEGRQDFFVNVVSKPFFFRDVFLPSESFDVADGHVFVMNCSARGNPDPTVSWQVLDSLFGWIPYTNYSTKGIYFSGEQNDVLHIPEVRLIHNGTYKCTARNRLGKRSLEFSIIWSGPPQLIGDRRVEKKIPIGKRLEIICEMEGIPEPTFTWEWQSHIKTLRSDLPNTEKSLVIDSVSDKDTGQYKCVASNPAGFKVQIFDVQVIKPPVLLRTSSPSLTFRTFEDIELQCTSEGIENEVYWMRGDFRLTKSDRVSLTSTLVPGGKKHVMRIINASKDDSDDNYKCILFNKAGEAKQSFNITILVPPQVISDDSEIEIELGSPVSIPCGVERDLDSDLEWKKDGTPLKEGTIIDEEVQIGAVGKDDGGNYTCTVINNAGSSSTNTFVKVLNLECYSSDVPNEYVTLPNKTEQCKGAKVLQYPHNECDLQNECNTKRSMIKRSHELIPPKMLDPGISKVQVLKRGGKIDLSCIAEGEPPPSFSWSKNGTHLVNRTSDNFWISADGTKLVKENITEGDAGAYYCFAVNKATPPAEYYYEVIVEGEREDHFPNGTFSNITKQYNQSLELTCPLSVFSKDCTWYKDDKVLEPTATTHVKLVKELSTLNVNNVLPEDGAIYSCHIEGNYTVTTYTFAVTVLIPFQWSNWTDWTECSRTCGIGEQTRRRSCDPPLSLSATQIESRTNELAQFINDSCTGHAEDRRLCNSAHCPIDGGLSEWSFWDECSVSCGIGVQRRERRCDNPLPSPGGRPCEGDLFEKKECKRNPCPVHGKWSDWSDWSPCSASCGYSVRHRDRQCNNPPPANGGNYCEGDERRQEENCAMSSCPGEGVWSEWSSFSNCSRPCGPFGFKKRTRTCVNKLCDPHEKTSQRVRCKVGIDVPPCRNKMRKTFKNRSRTVELLVNGNLNGEKINGSTVIITAYGNGSIALNATNPLKMKDAWFPYINFLVPPVTWIFAEEEGDSANGYSISQGKFKYNSHYYFSTGEVLNVDSRGLGMGLDKKFKISVTLLGSTPEARFNEAVEINPYKDNYIHRGDDYIFSGSSGELVLGGKIVEYTWNSTIDILKHPMNEIIYPVENVKTGQIDVSYDEKYDLIRYYSASTITYKLGNEECPKGFALDSEKDHCGDIDECKQGHKCLYSTVCKNTVGSYKCECPMGFVWDTATNLCQGSKDDTPMGAGIPAELTAPVVALSCKSGFERIDIHCEDINECLGGTPCGVGMTCINTIGSYLCNAITCLDDGALLTDDGSCVNWCNGSSSSCRYGTKVSESSKTIYVQESFLEYSKAIAKLTIPGRTQEEYTEFNVTSNHPELVFRIRQEPDYDVLYSLSDAEVPESLKINVFAIVYNGERDVQRTGSFSVHVYNTPNTPTKRRKKDVSRTATSN